MKSNLDLVAKALSVLLNYEHSVGELKCALQDALNDYDLEIVDIE